MALELSTKMKTMGRRLTFSRIMAALFAIIALIFIMLYAYSINSSKEAYRQMYISSLSNASSVISSMVNDEFDYERKYNEVCAELNTCAKLAQAAGLGEDDQKAVNELYYSFIKLPKEVKPNLNSVKTALNDIKEGDETGYDDIIKLLESFDKQNY